MKHRHRSAASQRETQNNNGDDLLHGSLLTVRAGISASSMSNRCGEHHRLSSRSRAQSRGCSVERHRRRQPIWPPRIAPGRIVREERRRAAIPVDRRRSVSALPAGCKKWGNDSAVRGSALNNGAPPEAVPRCNATQHL
jgi:hypothetical protein